MEGLQLVNFLHPKWVFFNRFVGRIVLLNSGPQLIHVFLVDSYH